MVLLLCCLEFSENRRQEYVGRELGKEWMYAYILLSPLVFT